MSRFQSANAARSGYLAGLSPAAVALLVTVAGWCAVVVWSKVLLYLGILEYRHWFIDSYAVLAASDAARLGLDPNSPNPLDPLLRNHKYSDWWYVFGACGLTRAQNFWVGLSWVGMFCLGTWATVRPRRWGEAAWLAAVMLSPPVVLAVNRANNDLVIFGVLSVMVLALAAPRWPRIVAAVGALVLATGLKFYPIVAVAGFAGVRPRRRFLVAAGGAALAAAYAFLCVADTMVRGEFDMPATLHTLGAEILLKDLGWEGGAGRVAAAAAVLVAAAWLARSGRTIGLGAREPDRGAAAAVGAVVTVACFFAGISYAYRWIFMLWPGIALWRCGADPAASARERRWARLGTGLLLACLWLDGALAAIVNLWFASQLQGRFEELQHVWRLVTQPVTWLLMALLAGWLLDWARRQAGELRTA